MKKKKYISFPGDLYPDNCLKCYELFRENYGATKFNRCAFCQLADVHKRKIIIEESQTK